MSSKQTSWKSVALLPLGFFLATGCGNPLGGHSQVDAGHEPGVMNSLPASKGSEFVSASAQMKKTSGSRFILQGALSSTSSQLEQKTSQRGYTLFSNVQGQFISGDVR